MTFKRVRHAIRYRFRFPDARKRIKMENSLNTQDLQPETLA
jgi:hypothetical protein